MKNVNKMIALFNDEQKAVFDEVIKCLQHNRGRLLYLDGPTGSGKTFIYKALISYLRGMNKICITTATTGIAADLIGGRTLHSIMKLPVPVNENTVSNIKCGSVEIIMNAYLIIINEQQ